MNSNPDDPTIVQYGIMALLALFGSIGRAGLWRDPKTGKFLWLRFVAEVCTAIVIGMMAGAFGIYKHIELPIVFGISGLLGLLGPATIIGFISARFGVNQNENRTNAN